MDSILPPREWEEDGETTKYFKQISHFKENWRLANEFFFNIVQNAFDTNEWGRTKDVNTHRKTLETVRVFHSSHQVFQAHVMLAAEIRKPWLTLILSINAKMTSPQTPLWMP